MNWLIIIIIVAITGTIFGYFNSGGNKQEALETGCMSGMGCGYIIVRIAIFLIGIWILLAIGNFLFG
ncbi:MAG: hypothetical protein PHC62_10390 [Candidatus Izemoplasmatales bacterium]|nr:hypothetical protein [Candidatus Izemoplasmatales bacterium]